MTTIYHLEMRDRAVFRPKSRPTELQVTLVDPPSLHWNRRMYQAVGGPWSWTDRLRWMEDDWQRYVERPVLETWLGRWQSELAGYFELEMQDGGNVEIAYFGLMPAFIGRGLGGPLLSAAIGRAWQLPGTSRVWVHTCTDDHPHALENYRQRGFEVFKIEPPGE